MSRAKDGERPLIDQAVAGNSPVYSHGCKSPLPVAEGVAGNPSCKTFGRKPYFRYSSQGCSGMTLYGYARVSIREPEDKNLDLQVERLVRAGCSMGNIRAEEASGAKDDRGGLLELLDLVVEGDTLVVTHIDRLSHCCQNLRRRELDCSRPTRGPPGGMHHLRRFYEKRTGQDPFKALAGPPTRK